MSEYTEEQYQKEHGVISTPFSDENLKNAGFNLLSISYGIVGQDEAKEILEMELTLRAKIDQPQKIIILEGFMGSGKTTLVNAICHEFEKKFPDTFIYQSVNSSSFTRGIDSSAPIEIFYMNILKNPKKRIIFIDEADELFTTRTTGSYIRGSRTTILIEKMNLEIPNILYILATNRPKVIDGAIISRCFDKIYCNLPSGAEIEKIIDMKMPFFSADQKKIIFENTRNIKNISGRDIFQLSQKFKTILQYNEVMGKPKTISNIEIVTAVFRLINSKKNMRNDYLAESEKDNDSETLIIPRKRRKSLKLNEIQEG